MQNNNNRNNHQNHYGIRPLAHTNNRFFVFYSDQFEFPSAAKLYAIANACAHQRKYTEHMRERDKQTDGETQQYECQMDKAKLHREKKKESLCNHSHNGSPI